MIAQEDFTEFSRRENFKSYISITVILTICSLIPAAFLAKVITSHIYIK
jgi:hypothetical protein